MHHKVACLARRFIAAALLALAFAMPTKAIDAPTPLTPADGSIGYGPFPNFTWSAVTGAARYQIQVAKAPPFTVIVADDTVDIARYVPDAPLHQCDRYWRVRAIAADGTMSAWSSTFLYQLRAPDNSYSIPPEATLAEIQAILNTAKANSPATVTFAAGATYRLNPTGSAVLALNNATDVIVDGNGCNVIIEKPAAAFMTVSYSSRLVIKNFNVDYDPLPHFVGKLEAKAAGVLTLRREPGYPDLTAPHLLASVNWGSILDRNQRGWLKAGVANSITFNRSSILPTADPDVFTIALATASNEALFDLGDPVIIFARDGTAPFVNNTSTTDVTFYRITNYACPSLHYACIYSSETKLIDCHEKLKDGTRWFAGNADGVHARSNLIGPWISGCTFQGLGDDAIALYNKGIFVNAKLSGTSVRVLSDYFFLFEGDNFVVFNPRAGRLIDGTFSVDGPPVDNGNGTYTVNFTPATAAAFYGGNSDKSQNDQLFNVTRSNNGFMIRNCTFDGVRRYGAIVRSSGGVIRDNVFRGVSSAPIMIRNEAHVFANGLHSDHLLVESNTIEDSGFDTAAFNRGDITVSLTTASNATPSSAESRLHNNLFIVGNSVKNSNHRAISVQNAVDCTIDGNTIWSDRISGTSNYGIYIDNTANSVIANNDLSGELRPLYEPVAITANNSNATSAGNVPPAPTIVKDNPNPIDVTVVGVWTSSSATGCFGPNALITAGGVAKSVRFTPTIDVAGAYDVYGRWSANINRATNTPIDVNHAGGLTTLSVNQRINGGTWNYLGTFTFDAGTNGNVTIRSDGADGYVVADAVWWVPTGGAP